MLNPTDRNEPAEKAAKLWRGTTESLKSAGESANPVYEFTASGKTFYLRLVSRRDRSRDQIAAELDFIFYLYANGVAVARPAASESGELVEEIASADDSFFACVFEQAAGARFRFADFTEAALKEHFRLRGRTLGQIHALSKNYVPKGNFRRFAWHEDPLLRETEKFLPAAEKIVRREYERLREELQKLPQSKETYGLIHGDFGETNYRCQASRLNIFDFDDCCYHWFACDLAVSIYPHGRRPEGLPLLGCLFEGYAEKTAVNLTLEDVTLFCHWRMVYLFLVYARKWGFKDLSPEQEKWFAQKRENIARGYQWISRHVDRR